MTLLPPRSDPAANCGYPTRTGRFAPAAGLTVTVNESVATSPPASVTVTVIVAVPVCPAAGVTVTVRLAPLPPNVTLAVGTRAVFDDAADRVRFPAAVSASPIVKATGPIAVPAVPAAGFGMSEMVGAVFAGGVPTVTV